MFIETVMLLYSIGYEHPTFTVKTAVIESMCIYRIDVHKNTCNLKCQINNVSKMMPVMLASLIFLHMSLIRYHAEASLTGASSGVQRLPVKLYLPREQELRNVVSKQARA